MKIALIIAVALIVSSCAGQPARTDYEKVEESKSHLLREPYKERIVVLRDVHPDCRTSKGYCIFTNADANIMAEDTEAQQLLIRSLNDALKSMTDEHNSLVRALIECEYGKQQREQVIEYKDNIAMKNDLINIGKQVLLVAGCAVLH